jgi:hypothetical protein
MSSARETTAVVVALAATVIAVFAWAKGITGGSGAARPHESTAVVAIDPRDPLAYKKKSPGERLFLMASDSHLACFPGHARGAVVSCAGPSDVTPADVDEEATVVGRFEAQAKEINGMGDWTFARIAFPSARPAELMIIISKMIYEGRRPDFVALGLRWGICTLSPPIRPEYLAMVGDGKFAAWLRAALLDAGADSNIIKGFIPASFQELRPIDRLEKKVAKWAGTESREQAYLRQLYRNADQGIYRSAGFTPYDPSGAACEVQLRYIEVMLRAIHKQGIPQVCYLPPEQLQRAPEYQTMMRWVGPLVGRVRAAAEAGNCPLIDARDAVSEQHFGWQFMFKDPLHMDPGGHALLASFLYDEGQRRQLWAPLGSHAL